MRFLRQYTIGCYIVDFYYFSRKFAIEIDGIQHEQEDAAEYVRIRTEVMNSMNIDVIRFIKVDVRNRFISICDKLKRRVSVSSS